MERTIGWHDGAVVVLDQRRLPAECVTVRWTTVDDAVDGISCMQVRGAPLIGVAAAFGVALAMAADASDASLASAIARLGATRPTAVNLAWALDRCAATLAPLPAPDRPGAAARLASAVADEDAAVCRRLGVVGRTVVPRPPGRRVEVLTHCNAGWLATVERGTALAPVYDLHDDGVPVHVWVSETRPRNQGALTAWELGRAGVDHTVVADNAAGHLLARGMVDVCLVGADRVAANGDVANKVGTYLKALAAYDTSVPFYVVAPTSTIDRDAADGAAIPIEERDPSEVLTYGPASVLPAGTPARNWAFDVTPARLVTGIVTELGVVPASPEGIASIR